MAKRLVPVDPGSTEPQLINWAEQTIIFAMMIRASERRSDGGIPGKEAAGLLHEASEVAQKVLHRVGPVSRHSDAAAWMTEYANQIFRWVQDHLER